MDRRIKVELPQEVKKPRLRKPPLSKREQGEKARLEQAKPRRIRKVTGRFGRLLNRVADFGAREYYLPLPQNRLGRFLNRRRSPLPRGRRP